MGLLFSKPCFGRFCQFFPMHIMYVCKIFLNFFADIVISPVVLESVQRMFEALTPTFQTLHPIGVVNHLHSQSLDRVESKNTLMKKEKSLDLQEKLLDTIKEPIKGKNNKKSEAESEMLRTFEKSVSSFVQASLHLPRVNFLCLQASVVEEMCAFSALDNVRDITCVSLLALGIQETTFQFCKTSQAKVRKNHLFLIDI